jgi:hypothetical protein
MFLPFVIVQCEWACHNEMERACLYGMLGTSLVLQTEISKQIYLAVAAYPCYGQEPSLSLPGYRIHSIPEIDPQPKVSSCYYLIVILKHSKTCNYKKKACRCRTPETSLVHAETAGVLPI